MAYSAVSSTGRLISWTLGDCGSADGRGALFERDPPFVMKELQSLFLGKPKFEALRVILERAPVTGRIECIAALARLLRELACRVGYRTWSSGRREGDDKEH